MGGLGFEDQNIPTRTTRTTLPFTRPCRRRLVKSVPLGAGASNEGLEGRSCEYYQNQRSSEAFSYLGHAFTYSIEGWSWLEVVLLCYVWSWWEVVLLCYM